MGSPLPHSPATDGKDEVWTVFSTQSTPGLQHSNQLFGGFIARNEATTGGLLHAYWGQMCKQ
ncbi:hypothetical protein ABZ383_00720 [Streptomyces sp. NPDC005900]|uniref:hypothetical protein n=1 Tax=Streptomyces sp. NPDC005900 TaxID=3154569 RepID=UPI0033F6535A